MKFLLIACRFSLVMFLLLAGVYVVNAQTKTQLKQEAETRLKQMTPEEIDAKLKDLGISRAEAIRKAELLNISLEDFLSRPVQAVEPTTGPAMPPPKSPFLIEVPQEKKTSFVPSFNKRKGADSLNAFGFDMFQYPASTFEPVLNIPTPPSYVLGPGDEVIITVWGETKLFYQLSVNREGNIIIPEVGPVIASGLTIGQFRDRALRRMASIYSGLDNTVGGANTFLDVSLGKLRTLQIFVLGEVSRPGGYALSSFSTVLHALYLSGGPTVNGTLRQVQVMRKGEKLPPVDLYQYILRGENANDHRLQDGDIVFVAPAGPRVAVIGGILREAIYELRPDETLGDLITIAGGLLFDAYFDRVHIGRVVPFDQRHKHSEDLLDIDLRFNSLSELIKSPNKLEDGDIVTVFSISDRPTNRVSITGNVNKPGDFELKPNMRIADLIREADSLQRDTFAERGTLFRFLPNLRREIFPFNPGLALAGDEANNLLLKNQDSLVLYKGSQFFPEHTVTIHGAVRSPGTYKRNENMSIEDLVVLAGGLQEDASLRGWEVSRLDTTSIGVYSKVFKIDMRPDYWNGSSGEKFFLKDFDFVFVPRNPLFVHHKLVTLTGYVMNPGTYALRYEGERLAEIIERAGGLRPGAYLEGSRLIRKVKNTGSIPIDFNKALSGRNARDNIVLDEGDSIHVAFVEDVVYVWGEVLAPSAILYKPGEGVKYYVQQAGGLTDEADEARVVAFQANGKKWEAGWFFVPDPDILPGSTIRVPKKVEKEDKTLPVIRDLATIFASVFALTLAVVQLAR